jgi:hypothetical protein
MTLIEIPDDQAAALKARAAAQGLTLKAWLGKLAEESPAAPQRVLKTGRGMLAGHAVDFAILDWWPAYGQLFYGTSLRISSANSH